MNKTVWPKQLTANRRNALKSSGPKTAAGKAASRMNAMIHGVLARQVLVRGHRWKESINEFKKTCREFHADLAPAGVLEEMLVHQIVTILWRLRRARMAEAGEIALSVDGGWSQRQRFDPRWLWRKWEAFGDLISRMEESGLGNRLLALLQ